MVKGTVCVRTTLCAWLLLSSSNARLRSLIAPGSEITFLPFPCVCLSFATSLPFKSASVCSCTAPRSNLSALTSPPPPSSPPFPSPPPVCSLNTGGTPSLRICARTARSWGRACAVAVAFWGCWEGDGDAGTKGGIGFEFGDGLDVVVGEIASQLQKTQHSVSGARERSR